MTEITMIYAFLRDVYEKDEHWKGFSATMDYYRYETTEYSKRYMIGNGLSSVKREVKICFEV